MTVRELWVPAGGAPAGRPAGWGPCAATPGWSGRRGPRYPRGTPPRTAWWWPPPGRGWTGTSCPGEPAPHRGDPLRLRAQADDHRPRKGGRRPPGAGEGGTGRAAGAVRVRPKRPTVAGGPETDPRRQWGGHGPPGPAGHRGGPAGAVPAAQSKAGRAGRWAGPYLPGAVRHGRPAPAGGRGRWSGATRRASAR